MVKSIFSGIEAVAGDLELVLVGFVGDMVVSPALGCLRQAVVVPAFY